MNLLYLEVTLHESQMGKFNLMSRRLCVNGMAYSKSEDFIIISYLDVENNILGDLGIG